MAIGASLFGWVQVTAGVVAALAALGTLVFAWLTVQGAQALKRDEQGAHLLDLAADYAELGSQAWSVDVRDLSRVLTRVRVAGHRFRVALDATGESLPACRALLTTIWEPLSMGDAERRQQEADDALASALDELTAWLRD